MCVYDKNDPYILTAKQFNFRSVLLCCRAVGDDMASRAATQAPKTEGSSAGGGADVKAKRVLKILKKKSEVRRRMLVKEVRSVDGEMQD